MGKTAASALADAIMRKMKRWRVLLLIFIVVSVGYAVHRVFAKRAEQKREIAYQEALRSYSEVLKPGMTRKDVEIYLKNKSRPFRQTCCMDSSRKMGTWDDLVKIGEEDAPWFCSNLNIYVGFQFRPHQQHAEGHENAGDPQDSLDQVRVYRWLEGCL